MKYLIFSIFFCSTLLVGCEKETPKTIESDIVSRIRYIKDTSTDLCYAFIEQGSIDSARIAMANVPCNKVQHRLP